MDENIEKFKKRITKYTWLYAVKKSSAFYYSKWDLKEVDQKTTKKRNMCFAELFHEVDLFRPMLQHAWIKRQGINGDESKKGGSPIQSVIHEKRRRMEPPALNLNSINTKFF